MKLGYVLSISNQILINNIKASVQCIYLHLNHESMFDSDYEHRFSLFPHHPSPSSSTALVAPPPFIGIVWFAMDQLMIKIEITHITRVSDPAQACKQWKMACWMLMILTMVN